MKFFSAKCGFHMCGLKIITAIYPVARNEISNFFVSLETT